jgi:ribose transport system permease protein
MMNLVGISPFTQQIVKGAIIIVAVSFEVLRRRR